MKKLTVTAMAILAGIVITFSTCKKEDISPEPLVKQLDSITHGEKLEYKFNYKNGIISEFIYYSSQKWRAEYKDGKIYRYYDENGDFLEFCYVEDNKVRVNYGDDETDIYEAIELNADGRPLKSVVYMSNTRTTYKYYYTNGNMTKMSILENKSVIVHLFEYDDNPNPWYELNVLDNFETFSKNNITKVNGYPYYSWTYDEDGYPSELHLSIDGIHKYYYK